jgi:predicted glycosyltransferase
MTSRPARVLFLPADGRGFGHLSRAGKLAHAIGRQATCVIASGQGSGRHLVPPGCEYAVVPGLETVLSFLVPGGGRPRVRETPPADVAAARSEYLSSLVERFDPDVIVTDHRPGGVHGEFRPVLEASLARKFAVLRPAPADDGAGAVRDLGVAELGRLYDAILVAGDRRTALVDEDLQLGDRERQWCRYIGYVSLPVSPGEIRDARERRGLGPRDRWVVCSVGSGFYHPGLVADCLELAREFSAVHFDLVSGPGAPARTDGASEAPAADGRVRLAVERADLRVTHAAADVVICHGGYNSMTEAMEGGAALIVDVRGDVHRERARHARRLQPYYPVAYGEGVADLARHLRVALSSANARRSIRERAVLDFDGCRAFARLIAESAERAGRDRDGRV